MKKFIDIVEKDLNFAKKTKKDKKSFFPNFRFYVEKISNKKCSNTFI